MDITNLFKASIKAVKTRNKALSKSKTVDRSILNVSKTKSTEFSTKSKDVVTNITKLRDFLLEHRKQYINVRHLTSSNEQMSDVERDQIDTAAQEFIRNCSETLKSIKAIAISKDISSQACEHRYAVLSLIDGYLKAVCKIYSEQRVIRMKRMVDVKRMARLEPERKQHSPAVNQRNNADNNDKQSFSSSRIADSSTKKNKVSKLDTSWQEESDEVVIDGDAISPEEMQMFQQENERIYEDMNNMVNEVRKIEGSVIEISKLQQVFTEKVLEQAKDIDRVFDTVVGTTENIKEGNEQIREAMKNNAGYRVYILFFLVVVSFSLLFLDWYSP
ncbi:PREDICTED: syntaxin-18-like isoform X2 [Priapulus caudatus]|uniref:Syntaxin-18-like isoform X2 n=1 Tax=Priapulus caudatus TaxID=37621 RepID=A0ABM1E5V5_PRICU|nr:PREDICTED: syntaxin-18-like isoform X2 [Priapulus caudatus]